MARRRSESDRRSFRQKEQLKRRKKNIIYQVWNLGEAETRYIFILFGGENDVIGKDIASAVLVVVFGGGVAGENTPKCTAFVIVVAIVVVLCTTGYTRRLEPSRVYFADTIEPNAKRKVCIY